LWVFGGGGFVLWGWGGTERERRGGEEVGDALHTTSGIRQPHYDWYSKKNPGEIRNGRR